MNELRSSHVPRSNAAGLSVDMGAINQPRASNFFLNGTRVKLDLDVPDLNFDRVKTER